MHIPRHTKTALLLAALLLTFSHSCNNVLNGLLELQREMIPVTTDDELLEVIGEDGVIIGIMNDITLTNIIHIDGGKNITITAFERDVKLKMDTSRPLLEIISVSSGTLNLGDRRGVGKLILEGEAGRSAPLLKLDIGASVIMNDRVAIKDNSGSIYGCGVQIEGGTFTMNGGEISGNDSFIDGGGVYVRSGGEFNMAGGTIGVNEASNNGGGVSVSGGVFTMTGGTIKGNKAASGGGGGVYVTITGTFTMTGGTISGNQASGGSNGGGGVYLDDGSFTMNSGTITQNTAGVSGGGVYVDNGSFTMNGGTITGNTATISGGGVKVSGGIIDGPGLSGVTGNYAPPETVNNFDPPYP